MARQDVLRVVDIHRSSFQGFFLSFLGNGLLRMYYRSIIDFGQIAMVCVRGSAVEGFVTGIDNSFGFYRKLLLRRGHLFALYSLKPLAENPRILLRLLRALTKNTPRECDGVRTATLTSIAVSTERQGEGIGHAMIQAFEAEARRRMFGRIVLDTDAVDNAKVLEFYEQEGYSVRRTYRTPERRLMHELRKEI